MIKSGINLSKKRSLEFFQFISTDIDTHVLKAYKVRLGKDIFKVWKLFLEKSILGRQTCIFFTQLFLYLLQLSHSIFKFILVVSLSHAASYSAFSIL